MHSFLDYIMGGCQIQFTVSMKTHENALNQSHCLKRLSLFMWLMVALMVKLDTILKRRTEGS